MTQTEPSSPSRAYSDVVQVFERNALEMPRIGDYLSDLWARRTFISELASAEIRGQQSSTFLGELWALVDPVFQACIYYFLFVVIRGGNRGGANQTAYVTAIIGSVFLWNYSRIAIGEAGRSILRHKGLVLNSMFPRAMLTVAELYKGLLSTLPALAIYAVLHLVVGAPITNALLLLPLLLVLQTGMNLGLALLLSTATVFNKDVSNLLNYLLRILTFATPVVYPVATLPPGVSSYLFWNPFFPLFSAFQGCITGVMPSFGQVFVSLLWAVGLTYAGTWVFLRHERSFALHV